MLYFASLKEENVRRERLGKKGILEREKRARLGRVGNCKILKTNQTGGAGKKDFREGEKMVWF